VLKRPKEKRTRTSHRKRTDTVKGRMNDSKQQSIFSDILASTTSAALTTQDERREKFKERRTGVVVFWYPLLHP